MWYQSSGRKELNLRPEQFPTTNPERAGPEIPAPKLLETGKSEIDVPQSKIDVPQSEIDVPQSEIDAPQSQIEIPQSDWQ
jgi:hypothetical protein